RMRRLILGSLMVALRVSAPAHAAGAPSAPHRLAPGATQRASGKARSRANARLAMRPAAGRLPAAPVQRKSATSSPTQGVALTVQVEPSTPVKPPGPNYRFWLEQNWPN